VLKDSKSLKNQRNFVDGKCLCDPDKWIVGYRDVIYPQRYFGERVFQQPRLLAKIVCRVFCDQLKDHRLRSICHRCADCQLGEIPRADPDNCEGMVVDGESAAPTGGFTILPTSQGA
jgi:hypothetical protein